MPEPIAAYQASLQTLECARSKVVNFTQVVSNAGRALQNNPLRVMVSNCDIGFPPEVAVSPLHSINAHEWPDAKRVAESLSEYHGAIAGARQAFSKIPEDQRGVVKPPPTA